MLFEHDVYFQSIARGSANHTGADRKGEGAYEYLRALRYELRVLPRFDRVQVCSPENRDYSAVVPARNCAGKHGRQPRGHRDLAL